MTVRVYIGASSSEITRVRTAEALLRAKLPAVEFVSTWPADVERIGDANPREASDGERSEMAYGCLHRVDRADIFWFLVPPVDMPTRGAWCELERANGRRIPCVASGDTKQSVFCALALETLTDERGAYWVAHIATTLRHLYAPEDANG